MHDLSTIATTICIVSGETAGSLADLLQLVFRLQIESKPRKYNVFRLSCTTLHRISNYYLAIYSSPLVLGKYSMHLGQN